MRVPKEELSKIAREHALRRVKDGTIPFCKGGVAHITLAKLNEVRLKDGSHNFIANNPVYKKVADGTLNLFGGDQQRQAAKNSLANGTHHSCREYYCPHCKKTGKGNGFKSNHFDKCKVLAKLISS
jgi:hypothetical protein